MKTTKLTIALHDKTKDKNDMIGRQYILDSMIFFKVNKIVAYTVMPVASVVDKCLLPSPHVGNIWYKNEMPRRYRHCRH